MILDTFSSPARRMVVLGLLILAPLIFITVIVMPLVDIAYEAIERLDRVRLEHGRLISIVARPPLHPGVQVGNGQIVEAQQAGSALSALSGRIGSLAASSAIKVESVTEQGGGRPDEICARIVATGAGNALAELVNQIERGVPLTRLASWSLTVQGAPDGGMRLDAIVVTAMTGPE